MRAERARLLASDAFTKYQSDGVSPRKTGEGTERLG
jgi:hypothetical protein